MSGPRTGHGGVFAWVGDEGGRQAVPERCNLHTYALRRMEPAELARATTRTSGTDEPTAEEVDQWVETFPVQVLSR